MTPGWAKTYDNRQGFFCAKYEGYNESIRSLLCGILGRRPDKGEAKNSPHHPALQQL